MRTRAGRVEVRAVRVVVEVTGARQRARELLGQARAPARRRRRGRRRRTTEGVQQPVGRTRTALVTTPVVVEPTSESRTPVGDSVGVCWRTSAAAPATCGAAIDVPLIVFVAVSLVCQAEVMLDPGAKMSRHVP